MGNNALDSAIKFGAGRYRQGADVLDNCGEEIARFGKRVFVLAGRRAFAAVEERFVPSIEQAGLEWEKAVYHGPCSHEAAKELARRCRESGCEVLCGIGGGVIMDLAKATGEYAGVPVVNIPTNIATCAAITTMSVMYTPEGAYAGNWRYDHEVASVLVDMQVMTAQPARYVSAGILDAMAKKIEILNGIPSLDLETAGYELYSAYRMAETTYELLEKYGKQAEHDVRRGLMTHAVEMVTFVNISMTGLLSNITKSAGQAALAHSMYYGVRTHFFKEAHHALHGEIVAVGLFIQLHYNKLDTKRTRLTQMMEKLLMPISLKELGVEPTDENLQVLEDFLKATRFVANTEESHRLLHESVQLLKG